MTRRARRPQVDLRRPSLLRAGASAALLVVFAGLWAAFAPTQLGGSATYVSTFGISMQPMLHKGDLVLVKPESDYRVGEVVAYHSDTLHTVVLHRIVGRDGDRYVFKGDNNTWQDTDHPARSQLVGAMQFVLPGGGDKLNLLHTPGGMGVATAAVVVPFFGFRKRKGAVPPLGETAKRPSAPNRTSRSDNGSGVESLPFFLRTPKGRAFASAAVAAVMLAGYAWTRPVHHVQTSDVPLDERGSFTYSAAVPGAADVYQGGTLTTGQPIYTNLVDQFDAAFDYEVSAGRALAVEGTARLDLVISDSTGWSRTIAVTDETPFTSGRAHVEGSVSVSAIRSLVAATEARTGVTPDGYTVSLHPVIRRHVQLGTSESDETFAPSLDLHLDQLVLALDRGATDKLTPTKGGLLTAQRTVASSASLLVVTLDVTMLRRLSLFLLAAVLVLVVTEFLRFRHDASSDDGSVMSALGAVIVPVAAVGGATGNVCSVDSQSDLVLIAQALNVPVLRLTDGSGAFVVIDGTTTYRYARRPAPHTRTRRREPLRAAPR